jgi:hypothetical protein
MVHNSGGQKVYDQGNIISKDMTEGQKMEEREGDKERERENTQ